MFYFGPVIFFFFLYSQVDQVLENEHNLRDIIFKIWSKPCIKYQFCLALFFFFFLFAL